jgi:UDP-N-acetylglucosamine 4-epimerase
LVLHGDGGQTRDFCPVENIVEANLLAATADLSAQGRRVFNVGLGRGLSLRELLEHLRTATTRCHPESASVVLEVQPERAGDIRHSYADTRRLTEGLGFVPLVSVEDGLRATVDWFAARS